MKTTVLFKKFEDSVIALFPDEIADFKQNITSYMHVGQHGAASPELMHLDDAKYIEYSPLLKELISIGYNLDIVTTQHTTAHRKPTQGEINFGHGGIHYRDIPLGYFIKRNGELKKWTRMPDDGLCYYR